MGRRIRRKKETVKYSFFLVVNSETYSMRITTVLLILALLSTKKVTAQNRFSLLKDSILPPHYFAVRIETGLLTEKPFTTQTGNYRLQSRPQGSFSGGFIYQLNMSHRWSMSYGLLFNVVSTNYYLHIPDSNLKGYPSTGGAPQIQDKEVYYKASLPVFLSYNFCFNKKGYYSVHARGKVNCSGVGVDLTSRTIMQDSSGGWTELFKGSFTYNKRPWLSYTAGVSKTAVLKNRGMLSVALFGEMSKTNFIKGEYQITVPNQPATKGDYLIKGSCIGLCFQYYFPKKGKV